MFDHKIGDTRCQILMLKCIKFDFRWGFAPDPAGGVYSTPPDPAAVFRPKGAYFKGQGGEGEETKGNQGENDLTHPLSQIPGNATAS